MKFLVDNQLPAALARFIETKGCQAVHVLDVGLAEQPDIEIFRRAKLDGYILISKDEDFLHLVLRPGTSAGLVWVRIGNCRKQHLLEVFETCLATTCGAHRSGRADHRGPLATFRRKIHFSGVCRSVDGRRKAPKSLAGKPPGRSS